MKDKIQQILAHIVLRHGWALSARTTPSAQRVFGATKHSHLQALRSDLHPKYRGQGGTALRVQWLEGSGEDSTCIS